MESCNLHVHNIEKLFHKTPVELPYQPSPNEKRKSLLYDIGGACYVEKLGQKLPELKRNKSGKKNQKEEDKINRILTEAIKMWNDWNFQIHWNKLEWVNPRSRDHRKYPFCVFYKKSSKYNVKPAHWVGHS